MEQENYSTTAIIVLAIKRIYRGMTRARCSAWAFYSGDSLQTTRCITIPDWELLPGHEYNVTLRESIPFTAHGTSGENVSITTGTTRIIVEVNNHV